MGTTKYFKQISEIYNKFSVIQDDFNKTLEPDLNAIERIYNKMKEYPNSDVTWQDRVSPLEWDELRVVIDRFDNHIKLLKSLKTDLERIRMNVDNRGIGLFKHGNIKKKLDSIVSVEAIKKLKDEMKEYVDALKKSDTRQTNEPIRIYLQRKYEERRENEDSNRKAPTTNLS